MYNIFASVVQAWISILEEGWCDFEVGCHCPRSVLHIPEGVAVKFVWYSWKFVMFLVTGYEACHCHDCL